MQARHVIRGIARFALLAITVAAFAFQVNAALVYSNRYRSPRNPERKIRKSTTLIVLHTTEGAARGSLNKVCERGECHYCVTEDGTVYNIVDLKREAFHAGRSMWFGREDCDEFSVGIEVVGYHNQPVTLAQINALRELIAFLKGTYNLSDNKVVCHSHIAYGAPNKWQKQRHRGRKRCGMLFAMPSVRALLGLKSKPEMDPDVRAKRLVQADQELAQVLYGKRDTMVGKIGTSNNGGVLNSIKGWFKKEPVKPTQATVRPRTWKPVQKAKPKVNAKLKLKTAKVTRSPSKVQSKPSAPAKILKTEPVNNRKVNTKTSSKDNNTQKTTNSNVKPGKRIIKKKRW